MASITETKAVPLKELLANILLYRYNPTNIQRVILDHLSDVTNGKIDIVDPTSPFIFLLEASTVNTAAAMQENRLNLRRQYKQLAQSVEEIYPHMSDKNFINLFAIPSKAKFNFMIQMTSFENMMVKIPNEAAKKVTIPRNTQIKFDNYIFSLQYPIDIRKFDNDEIQISYDATRTSPLQTLTTNIIPKIIRKDAAGVEWLNFSIELSQFNVSSSHFAVQAETYIDHTVNYDDSYYHCRVFYKKDNQTVWTEMKTTLTDQVYDPFVPTAVLTPNDETKTVRVFIPPVYVNSGLVDGNLRVDVYDTKGSLNLDTSNYLLTSFETTLLAMDEENDTSVYTAAMNNVSMRVYTNDFVTGGNDAITFEALRTNVINNASGEFDTPITNVQLISSAQNDGFTIVKNVDVVTNRIFLATRDLPAPANNDLITPANLTVDTLVTNLDKLKLIDSVKDNGLRLTILSKTLYRSDNGVLNIVEQANVAALQALPLLTLCGNVNDRNYLYSPFYYVLDSTSHEFDLRAYHLDEPMVDNLSFISQNPTAGISVNTNKYSITKTETGFKIVVEVSSNGFYKSLQDSYVQAQLSFLPVGEISYAFINGVLEGKNAKTDERIFSFTIDTNFDITRLNDLVLTNFEMFANESMLTQTPLKNTFRIHYTTNSVPLQYISDTANTHIGNFLLPVDTIAVTEETIDITFGYNLENLWSRSRSVQSGSVYQTYDNDIPLTYTEDVYATNPTTNSIFDVVNGNLVYTKLHSAGDVVLDDQGQVVYKHLKGDPILDDQGVPLAVTDFFTERHMDLLLVDGAYYFATDDSHVSYRREVANTISTWITGNLVSIEQILLEQSEIFFYPTSAIGLVDVYIDKDTEAKIEARQSFDVVLNVSETVYNDTRIRKQLEKLTIQTLSTSLQNIIVSISDIVVALKTAFGASVVSFKVTGLGGASKYDTIAIKNENESLSLNKILRVQDDGSLIVSEAVNISFVKFTS
jgi:hypothetical protein